MRDAVELAGPLGTLLGSANWKRASSRGEAGTSGFLSVSDSDCTVPAVLGQESHASSCLRKGTPLASRVVRGFQAPGRAVCGSRGSFRMMHGGVSAPSCCAFTHRVAFEEGSGPRVLLKGRLVIGGVRHVAPPTWLVSNFLVRPALRRTRGPDPSSKATLWVKAQHEGALPPPCIIQKNPQGLHTARQGS